MPSLNNSFLNLLQDDYTKYNCFIETGTLNGSTIFALEPYFNTLYTIEFSETYYNRTKNRCCISYYGWTNGLKPLY